MGDLTSFGSEMFVIQLDNEPRYAHQDTKKSQLSFLLGDGSPKDSVLTSAGSQAVIFKITNERMLAEKGRWQRLM